MFLPCCWRLCGEIRESRRWGSLNKWDQEILPNGSGHKSDKITGTTKIKKPISTCWATSKRRSHDSSMKHQRKSKTHRIRMSYRNTEQRHKMPRTKMSPPPYPRRRWNTSKPLPEHNCTTWEQSIQPFSWHSAWSQPNKPSRCRICWRKSNNC